ncbi:MAG TPA: sigma-70 family RNA polymerase sigma factor [Bacteroidetes bacterium]|nr:sigma-70 family RNA polymerase sigma factor [Bacteroidota bacterium]
MQTTEKLIKQIASGSRDAFSAFYDELAPTVYGIALRITESKERAVQVVKKVFAQVWTTAPSFDASRHSAFYWVMDLTKKFAFENESKNEQFNFFAYQESNSAGYNLLEVMNKIDEKHRRVLELAYFRNLTEKQIEEEMNIPVGTVATRLRLAIKAMRPILG